MKNFFYFVLILVVVFVSGLLPALGASSLVETELWTVAIWGSLCGTIFAIGSYWFGATIEGGGKWNTGGFVAQLIGAVVGGVLASLVFLF